MSTPEPASSASSQYSIPKESAKIFRDGILGNKKISKYLPREAFEFASSVKFVGSDTPSIPVNWRFAETSASLKALEAAMVDALLRRKYRTKVSSVTINTDHAQLFFASMMFWTINPGKPDELAVNMNDPNAIYKYIKNCDLHKQASSLHRICATNIYRTADGQYYHVHGSMNPNPTLDALGLPHDAPAASWDEACRPFIAKVASLQSKDLETMMTDGQKQAGVIAMSPESFRASEHGQANSHVGLFEIFSVPSPQQPPCWWPDTPQTSPQRPLAGLKVIDLSRVIAAPAVTRGLAELGASVMRITSPNICDFSSLHLDLNWGKWNASIDLRTEEGKERLRALVRDADVVVQGYRPGVLDKYGFGQQDIIDLCQDRDRGVISVRENCYGWYGPWANRSGWQQISDACTGISHSFGKAMGLTDGEAVTPIFPNSDYMTGIAGTCAVISALLERSEHGGSYKVDLSLNYYNSWLADTVGVYPDPVWQDVWKRNENQVFRYVHGQILLRRIQFQG